MATVQVKNSSTGTMGTSAAKRTRYEKMETAYGKIPAAAYAVGDTLSFDDLPMKELVHARFTGNGEVLEVFHGASLASALAFDVSNTAATADISYVIHYKKGTGAVKAAGTYVGDGELLKITVSST